MQVTAYLKTRGVWCLLAGLTLLSTQGCTRSARQLHLPVEVPDSFIAAPQTKTAEAPEPPQNNWSEAFADAELNLLIDWALTGNFTLRTAWDRLAQAEAITRQAGAHLSPQVDLDAGYRRSRQQVQGQTFYNSVYSVGTAAGYEVDLWSRIRSSRQAAVLDAEASRNAIDAAAISLTAAVAGTWYQLAEAQALVRIARSQIETNEQVLQIVTAQFGKGMAAAADVLRQRQLVAATEAQLISAQETVELLQYTLSVLIGVEPRLAWQDKPVILPELGPTPEVGIPTDVLRRRPDVRQAYRQVQAADLRLAGAIADKYPRLSLSASIETSAPSVHDLFDDWLGNLAANAVQPLFDGRQRQAEVERQRALVSERIHTWSQVVLDALFDVEAALTQQRQQAQLLASIQHQLDLARQTYERNGARFIKGQADYIRVLESLQSLQSLEREVVRAQRTLVQRRIDLYRAIAGPCELAQPVLAEIQEEQAAL
ncbi:MAG: efflux transporter outer membrane subunit [Sedimentisphaerales bacterium]|nr:efflux transporter outer membrane subunit [Sedimentisphaerales bacterium]